MVPYQHILMIIDEADERQREVRRGIYAAARPVYPWGFHGLAPSQVARSPRYLEEADGWIGFPDDKHLATHPELYRARPHVCLRPGSDCPPHGPQIDFTAVGREAVRYFQGKGYRHFALVASRDVHRKTALEAGMLEIASPENVQIFQSDIRYHIPKLPEGVRSDFYLELYGFLHQLDAPCAVITEDAQRGLEVIEICRRTGIAVPGHLAVLSAEDGSRAGFSFPPCTAFELPWHQMGREAARMLAAQFRSEAPGRPVDALAPVRLHERASTDMMALPDPMVRHALQVIREQACAGLTVDTLLQEVHRPRRWLERHFKAHTGTTPLQEIHRIRMQKAKELLLDTEMTQDQIAEACGFNSLPRFMATFRKHEGSAPGAFRKRMRS